MWALGKYKRGAFECFSQTVNGYKRNGESGWRYPILIFISKRVQKLQAAFAFTLIKSSRNQLKKSARIFISRRLDIASSQFSNLHRLVQRVLRSDSCFFHFLNGKNHSNKRKKETTQTTQQGMGTQRPFASCSSFLSKLEKKKLRRVSPFCLFIR
jgi:hypothetical protein